MQNCKIFLFAIFSTLFFIFFSCGTLEDLDEMYPGAASAFSDTSRREMVVSVFLGLDTVKQNDSIVRIDSIFVDKIIDERGELIRIIDTIGVPGPIDTTVITDTLSYEVPVSYLNLYSSSFDSLTVVMTPTNPFFPTTQFVFSQPSYEDTVFAGEYGIIAFDGEIPIWSLTHNFREDYINNLEITQNIELYIDIGFSIEEMLFPKAIIDLDITLSPVVEGHYPIIESSDTSVIRVINHNSVEIINFSSSPTTVYARSSLNPQVFDSINISASAPFVHLDAIDVFYVDSIYEVGYHFTPEYSSQFTSTATLQWGVGDTTLIEMVAPGVFKGLSPGSSFVEAQMYSHDGRIGSIDGFFVNIVDPNIDTNEVIIDSSTVDLYGTLLEDHFQVVSGYYTEGSFVDIEGETCYTVIFSIYNYDYNLGEPSGSNQKVTFALQPQPGNPVEVGRYSIDQSKLYTTYTTNTKHLNSFDSGFVDILEKTDSQISIYVETSDTLGSFMLGTKSFEKLQ